MKQQMMHLVLPLFETIVFLLYILCILVLMWGIVLAIKDFFQTELRHPTRVDSSYNITGIRSFLGSYILLSLEILIAADIVESIINPSIQDLIILASMVVIRTVMAYFLHKEMMDAKKEQEELKK
ncbi:DUF1622 domain-containing protein [Enterococcus sp. DIV1314a]|uniref:DUF1622 domain-containing protein n=1 Tax=Enterococcus sp. DIV1314a TaxID=2774660 RepID=UPI003F24D5FA